MASSTDDTADDAVTVSCPALVSVVVISISGGIVRSVADVRATYSHVAPLIGHGVVPPGAAVVNVNSHSCSDPAGIRSDHGWVETLFATGSPAQAGAISTGLPEGPSQ